MSARRQQSARSDTDNVVLRETMISECDSATMDLNELIFNVVDSESYQDSTVTIPAIDNFTRFLVNGEVNFQLIETSDVIPVILRGIDVAYLGEPIPKKSLLCIYTCTLFPELIELLDSHDVVGLFLAVISSGNWPCTCWALDGLRNMVDNSPSIMERVIESLKPHEVIQLVNMPVKRSKSAWKRLQRVTVRLLYAYAKFDLPKCEIEFIVEYLLSLISCPSKKVQTMAMTVLKDLLKQGLIPSSCQEKLRMIPEDIIERVLSYNNYVGVDEAKYEQWVKRVSLVCRLLGYLVEFGIKDLVDTHIRDIVELCQSFFNQPIASAAYSFLRRAAEHGEEGTFLTLAQFAMEAITHGSLEGEYSIRRASLSVFLKIVDGISGDVVYMFCHPAIISAILALLEIPEFVSSTVYLLCVMFERFRLNDDVSQFIAAFVEADGPDTMEGIISEYQDDEDIVLRASTLLDAIYPDRIHLDEEI